MAPVGVEPERRRAAATSGAAGVVGWHVWVARWTVDRLPCELNVFVGFRTLEDAASGDACRVTVPTDPEGPVGKFIEKRGEGIHHIAFAVDNIEERLREAEEAGIRLIDNAPRKGAEGLSIAFLHPKSTFGVLTELCEDKNSETKK